MRYAVLLACLLLSLPLRAAVTPAPDPRIDGKTAEALAADLAAGRVTAEALVQAYLARIDAVDRNGPALHAVLALNPRAIEDAKALDQERRAGHVRGPLHGIPVLVKDNIETAELPTTAGSLALRDNTTHRDAPAIARLRAAGAIILGKTNLSEWANMRGSRAISAWSAVGGLTRNPYALDRSPCGSSSGSGAAVAAGLAPLAIGTETDGSVTCPASVNGIVGLKPTVGLISRTHVVPISHSQDTPGPMAATVRDTALLLQALAGSDPADPATKDADQHVTDYAGALDAHALAGKRLGVLRFDTGYHPELDQVFAGALNLLRRQGAVLVDIPALPGSEAIGDAELTVLLTELKADLNAYLATAPETVKTRTLADLIAFNQAHHDRELALFGQEYFERAQATGGLKDLAYVHALELSRRLAGADGIDKLLAAQKLDALVAPTAGPTWVVDTINGDHSMGSSTTLPAVAGYPHISVPMGNVFTLPVGLSIIGPAWSEARLLSYAYAFETALGLAQKPGFPPSVVLDPPAASLFAPAAP